MDISALLTQYGDKYLQALLTTWKLTVFAFAIAFLIGILITVKMCIRDSRKALRYLRNGPKIHIRHPQW